jgi:hypothetical protein
MPLSSFPFCAAININTYGDAGVIFPNLVGLWALAATLLTALIHVAFAWAVLDDAGVIWRIERRKTLFVSGGLWALATLLGGVLVAGLYWAMHHSTLRPETRPASMRPEAPRAARDSDMDATR